MNSLLVLLGLFSSAAAANTTLPVVIWHGMGDTCCFPFSMGMVKDYLLKWGIPFVYSVEIGNDIVEDEISGFFGNVNDQIASTQAKLKAVPELANGFNAIGFSQGGQFFRAFVQRYNDPPVANLITIGAQHLGVSDFPKCLSTNQSICEVIAELLGRGAYLPGVRDVLVQAQYFRDPVDEQGYLSSNIFLPDINNEGPVKNAAYKRRLMSLKNFVLVRFDSDTTVVPRSSEWFETFQWGSLGTIVPLWESDIFTQDWIGLKVLNETGRLTRLGTPGDHMQLSLPWFKENIIDVYLIPRRK